VQRGNGRKVLLDTATPADSATPASHPSPITRSEPHSSLLTFPPRHPGRIGVICVLLGLLILLGGPSWYLFRAYRQLSDVQTLALASRGESSALAHLPEIQQNLAGATANLQFAREQLRPLDSLFRATNRIPALRGLSTVPDLFDLGIALVGAGSDIVSGVGPVETSSTGDWRRAVVVGMSTRGADFVQAQQAVADAAEIRTRIDRTALTGPFEPVGKRLDQLDKWFPTLQAGANALPLLPGLLGAPHPVTYLLMGQNEDERRATGGFMSSLGVVRLDSGDVTALDLKNSYDYAPPGVTALPPPEPLATWMGFGGWYIRDANWFPDFPTSAAWVEWFWSYYYDEQADGVIAFDQTAVEQLLTVTGPIDLPDLHETITAQNYRERSLYWVYLADSPNGQRQWIQGAKTSFVRELGSAMFKRLLALSPTDLLRFAPAINTLFAEKHLQVSLRNPSAAQLLAQQGWDGHLDRSASDYLLASDLTVTYTKLAPFINKTVDEQIDVRPDGSATVSVAVSYQNNFNPDVAQNTYPHLYLGEFWNQLTHKLDYQLGYYVTYLRLYIPQNAQMVALTDVDRPPTNDPESGRRVIASYVELPMGAQRTAHLVYDLPTGTWTVGQPHRIVVQKEPGTAAVPLSLEVSAPDGYDLAGAPKPGSTSAAWSTDLRTDRSFVVTLERSPAARVPLLQHE
jgi:Protein of unknown function (DUF4012)